MQLIDRLRTIYPNVAATEGWVSADIKDGMWIEVTAPAEFRDALEAVVTTWAPQAYFRFKDVGLD